MRHLIVFLFVSLMIWPTYAAGPSSMGPLAPYIEIAPQGQPWQVSEDEGSVVFQNASDAGALTYRYVEPKQRPVVASVRTTANSNGQGMSGSGLLYALQGEGNQRLYYLFLLQPDGTASVFRRDSGGISRMIASRNPDLDASAPVELKIEESNDGAAFFVNGNRMGKIQSKGIGSGAVGIAAAGAGRFTFRDFQLGTAD